MRILRLIVDLTLIDLPRKTLAQEAPPPEHQHPGSSPEPPQNAWSWTGDANVIFGYNYQNRKFTDFSVWESQNWFMLNGQRRVGRGQLTVDGMLSLEPFTMHAIGSPQVFQTGEHYQGGPLIDISTLTTCSWGWAPATGSFTVASLRLRSRSRWRARPRSMAFIHRESGRDNPQAPMAHHYMDSTHTSPGVLRAGVDWRGAAVDGSWFRGLEPDDNRLNIERPWLDSWSLRASWQRGPWQTQFSGARLQRPELYSYSDMTRLTASIIFTVPIGSHSTARDARLGRESRSSRHSRRLPARVGRAERRRTGRSTDARKRWPRISWILVAGPPGFVEFHRISHVAAFTLGYLHDISHRGWGRIGVGADMTACTFRKTCSRTTARPSRFMSSCATVDTRVDGSHALKMLQNLFEIVAPASQPSKPSKERLSRPEHQEAAEPRRA